VTSSPRKKAAVTRKRRPAGKKATTTRKPRAKMMIDDVTAILLVSPNAKKLCEFYRATLGIPLEEEVHDGIPLHYGYALGDVQFAIHPANSGWPGVPTRNAQSPVIGFSTSDLKSVAILAEIAVGKPLNATIDIAGPEPIRMDDLVRQYLAANRDPHKVITDPAAGYFGTPVTDECLVPGANFRRGPTRFGEWLRRADS